MKFAKPGFVLPVLIASFIGTVPDLGGFDPTSEMQVSAELCGSEHL